MKDMAADEDPISEAISGTVDDATRGCFGSFLVLILLSGLTISFIILAAKAFLS